MRIVDHDFPDYNNDIEPGSSRKWRDLDNSNVEFRTGFRPRARYLYFHYCVQIPRKVWKEQKIGNRLKNEFGRWYWGIPGRYVPKKMIFGLLEEFGHKWEDLTESAMEDEQEEEKGDSTRHGVEDDEPNMLLTVISNQIKAGVLGTDPDDEEDDDDSPIDESGGADQAGENTGFELYGAGKESGQR
ncbi:MAG: hypothetical protein MMC33_001795 [Icmadophila ericetorum]|nr:hypothetical protein [Icmadophila ericetorum]